MGYRLEELEGLEHCMSLKEVTISGCPKLQWDKEILKQMRQRVENCEISSAEEIRELLAGNVGISRTY